MDNIELSVIYELLINENSRYMIDKLEDKYFNLYKNYFHKMKELYNDGKLNALEMVMYDPELTCKIQDMAFMGNTIEDVSQKLINNYNLKILNNTLQNALEEIKEGKDIKTILSKINGITNEFEETQEIKDQNYLVYNFSEYLSQKSKGDKIFNTGLPSLDNKLGPINNSNLVIISARAGAGKTTFALQTMINMLQKGNKAMYISLEMDSNELALKIYSRLSEIDSREIIKNPKEVFKNENFIAAQNDILESKLIIVDNTYYINDIISNIKYLKSKNMIDVVFIDYIGLIKSKEKSYSRENEIAKISRDLKILAKELNIPIIVLAQLNRLAEGQEPTLAMLRDSGSLEQDANKVIFLWQDEQNKNEICGNIKIRIAKNREGERGDIEASINKSIGKIYEIDRRFENGTYKRYPTKSN